MSQLVKKIRTESGDLQIDYNALANLPTISNPNLLINSDFRNPINQRNISKYTGQATRGYTIDRWCMAANDFNRTVEVVDGGVLITNPNTQYTGTFQQVFDKSFPKGDYTLSVKVISKTGAATMSCGGSHNNTRKDLAVGINTLTLSSATINSFDIILNTSSSIKLEWAKLEVGTVATQFSPRIHAEEAALCKPFYQVITLRNTDVACYLHKRNVDEYGGTMHFDQMRAIPTVTKTGDFYVEQYNSSGQVYGATEGNFAYFEMTPQWSELRFGIKLTTPDPVNYLASASESLVLRFDAEIY